MVTIVRPMQQEDIVRACALWSDTPGVGLSRGDEVDAIAAYLARNPGISFVAEAGNALVGAVQCGYDGRRGYLYHLAVAPSHRRQGIGRRLVEACLAALQTAGIQKCHLVVFAGNRDAQLFWRNLGWSLRDDVVMMSKFMP